MKISKQALDEAIQTYREYLAKNLHNALGDKFFHQCVRLEKECYVYDNNFYMTVVYFYNIISTYIRCNATNETIYKAIELLGIEIEGEEQSESKPKYERLTDRDIAVTLNNNECEDMTRFYMYAQRLWEIENKIEQGKLVFREGNNEQI